MHAGLQSLTIHQRASTQGIDWRVYPVAIDIAAFAPLTRLTSLDIAGEYSWLVWHAVRTWLCVLMGALQYGLSFSTVLGTCLDSLLGWVAGWRH